MSRWLTRASRFGHDLRLCPSCARADHHTCSSCRRYRRLISTMDGRLLCKDCTEKGEVPCPSCKTSMPAGRGDRCESCYWTETFRKRICIAQEALTAPAMREAFRKYGDWLAITTGQHKAALTLHRHLSFFVKIDTHWQCLPTHVELFEKFSAEELRRVRLPIRWLCDTLGVKPDPSAKERGSEQRRIEALAESLPSKSQAAMIFAAYRKALLTKHDAGNTSLRSVRLALRPAVSLLLSASPQGDSLPSQSVLDRYLLMAPGQKAAVTGFIRFLSTTYGLRLAILIDHKKVRGMRRRTLEKKIIQMAKHPEVGKDFEKRWIVVNLEYFHGIKCSKRKLESIVPIYNAEGIHLRMNDTLYFLPHSHHWMTVTSKAVTLPA